MWSWVSFQTILSAFNGIVGLIRDFFSWKKSADDRQAGADAAVVAGQKREDEALSGVGQAVDAARENHKADPTDGAFKHTEFRD